MLIPQIGDTAKVCLQSWMGTFVAAENGGDTIVGATRTEAKDWECFEMHRVDADRVTLKANNGMFLCAEGGGGKDSLILANRQVASDWETFIIYIDQSGLVSFQTSNGHFVGAPLHGVLIAQETKVGDNERFRVVAPDFANDVISKIEVNVYKIHTAPFWHTGTVINGVEYYFQTTNRVETTSPRGMLDLTYHRTLTRFVPGNIQRIELVKEQVVTRWNGTRYDVAAHNCDFFTNDLLTSLGVPGLDQEYLDASGIGKGVRQLPGTAMLYETVFKWPLDDKRLDQAFMDDLRRFERLPEDLRAEIARLGGNVSAGFKAAGGALSDAVKDAGGQAADAAKHAGGVVSDGSKEVGKEASDTAKEVGREIGRGLGW